MFAIPWGLVLKVAALLAMAAATVGGAWYGIHAIHDNGRDVERAKCLAKEVVAATQTAENVRTAVIAVQQYWDEQARNLNEVIDEKDRAIADLQKRERNALAANRGLWVSAAACDGGSAMPVPKTDSASLSGSRSGRVRLPGQDESNIRLDYGDAQRVVIQYAACRERLKSVATVEE